MDLQATESTPRALLRWRRRSKTIRRCRPSTFRVCGSLASVCLRGKGGPRWGPRECASARAERRERLVVWSARRARVRAVSAAWCVCRQRHRRRGRCCAGGGAPRQHDAADAQPLLYADRPFKRVLEGMGGRSGTSRMREPRGASGFWCGRHGVRECGQWAQRGGCADNGIDAEGAVALSAALQDNTALQTLDLRGMRIARICVFAGTGGRLGSLRAERRERLAVRSDRRARVRAVSTAWGGCRQRHRRRGCCCAGGGAQRQHDTADARPFLYVDC
jgi:hypothetical protein